MKAHRSNENKSVSELLDDVVCYYSSDKTAGVARGRRAITELLYRWGYLPDGFFDLPKDMRDEMTSGMASEEAVATIAKEADERGYDHDLYLPEP